MDLNHPIAEAVLFHWLNLAVLMILLLILSRILLLIIYILLYINYIIKKNITFRLGNYLSMWVTFDVFTCNRMIKLKIASKRSELHCNWVRWLIWKLEHLANTPQLAILMIKVCWGNWNVSPHAGIIHMTCTVICFEITLEKCICVSRSILSTVPPSNKNQWFPGNWPFFCNGA